MTVAIKLEQNAKFMHISNVHWNEFANI